MRDIELEEGEAYFLQDDDDNDDNIDPDRDLSYIDWKLEIFLGHYQKDFMRGFSADCLGPIFGGYGSFLPVQERSPPILSNQRNQSHVKSKSAPKLPPEGQHFSQNPTVAANTSLPARTVPVSSNQSLQFLPESGISFVDNQLKVKSSAETASDHHQQPKKPLLHHSEHRSLKFRVKMASESVLSRDNTAIYSGLGLDMSPSSSPEGSPLENDGTLLGLPEMNLESPSFILKIMTSMPLPNDAPISPLHDDLICLLESENTLENGLPGIGQAEPLNIIHDSAYLDGKEVIDEKEPKLKGTCKVKNSKQKEASKEMKPKQITKRQKPAELVKEDNKEEGNAIKITSKTEKDKNVIAIPKDEPGTEMRNEFGRTEDEANKFRKQHSVVKDKVKEEDFDSIYPKKAYGYGKESGKHEKIAKDKEVCGVSENDVKYKYKHYDIPQDIKPDEFVSSKQKSCARAMPRLQVGPSLQEPSSSLVKKKLKDIQTGNVLPRGSVVSSSGGEYEEVIRKNIPSRSKRGDVDLPREMRKDSKVAVVENPSKKEKESSSRGVVMGATEREAKLSASKMMEQSSSKKTGFAISGHNLGGDVVGVNCSRERVFVDELMPLENASLVPLVPLEMDDWVQCEKCQKWRLLPFGTNPDSLPKEWICSMLTWLPGMNKCSVSEDETTHALRAMYLPSASGLALQVQNVQQAQLGGTACVKALAGAQNTGLSNLAITADVMLRSVKKQSFPNLEIHVARQSGTEDLHRPIKKDPQHTGGIRSLKNLEKNPKETACASKNAAAASKPSKISKKRMAEGEVSGVPKKMKKVHQQSIVSSGHTGLLPLETKGESQNYDPDAFRISRDFVHESSECPPPKVKNRGQSAMAAIDVEVNDVSEKKRKLKDQRHSANALEPSVNGQLPSNNLVTGKNSGTERRQERRTNAINIEESGGSADKGCQGSRAGPSTLEPCRTDRLSRMIADARKSSEKALDFGVSDHATTSSSSKVSTKVKVNAREVKCLPVGSISSPLLKVCKSDPDKGTDKIAASYDEPEELSSRKRHKSRADGAFASNEFAPHREEMDRKSNLARTAGVMSDTALGDQFSKKVSSGKHYTAHRVDALPKLEDFEGHDGKLDRRHHVEGIVASQRNPESQMPNGLQLDRTSFDRQKLHASNIGIEKESSLYSQHIPEFEKGSGSNSVRHPHHTAHASKDIEASSSKKKDSFHWAVTALKEARDLKHSANCLKNAGSGFSTGLFFQAALKFLYGASLLESENSENGRIGEMSSIEVYSSTAKLCEYCAHEFEKCNDMASAALAYKCMEVAYMRVVYNNDVAASRDRAELQVTVSTAPQAESPSSSASDIDNLNNHVAIDIARDGLSVMDHPNHVISAGNRPNFVRLLGFLHDMNLAMEASRRSQNAFAVANPILSQEGNEEEGISCIKRVLDFSFHDVNTLLHLVRLAMEALNN